jgi:hypothetical protein
MECGKLNYHLIITVTRAGKTLSLATFSQVSYRGKVLGICIALCHSIKIKTNGRQTANLPMPEPNYWLKFNSKFALPKSKPSYPKSAKRKSLKNSPKSAASDEGI